MRRLTILVAAGILSAYATADARPQIERFDPAKYKGPVGKIRLPERAGVHYMILQRAGSRAYVYLKPQANPLIAPAGDFRVVIYGFDSKNHYSLSCSPRSMRIEVKDGKTTELDLGQDLSAHVDVTKAATGGTTLNLVMSDRDGNSCSIRGPKPPRFQITLESGKVVQEGAFKYG